MSGRESSSSDAETANLGYWFTGKKTTRELPESEARDYAPKYVLDHRDKYRELLLHPDILNERRAP